VGQCHWEFCRKMQRRPVGADHALGHSCAAPGLSTWTRRRELVRTWCRHRRRHGRRRGCAQCLWVISGIQSPGTLLVMEWHLRLIMWRSLHDACCSGGALQSRKLHQKIAPGNSLQRTESDPPVRCNAPRGTLVAAGPGAVPAEPHATHHPLFPCAATRPVYHRRGREVREVPGA